MKQTSKPSAEKKTFASSGLSDLAQNVTAENYLLKSKAFLAMSGTGFLIALRNGVCQGEHFSSTPKQWGAWRAYLVERKIGVKFMDKRGKSGECFTVPAEWPHLFDADAMIQRDYEIGEAFLSNYRPEAQRYADLARRQAFIASIKSQFPNDPKRHKTPQDHLNPEIAKAKELVDALLHSHDVGMNESAERKSA